MADQSEKGLRQSGGIMVNYVYRYSSHSNNFNFFFFLLNMIPDFLIP